MERKLYQLTEKQIAKCHEPNPADMPTDDWFKQRWMKDHHGKVAGWGMGKRNHILSQMTYTREYQQGLWQGRVDSARGLPYSEERNENTYNLGYHRGYNDFQSDFGGWDKLTREKFTAEYING